MNAVQRKSIGALACWALLSLTVAGCSQSSAYTPTGNEARRALEATLTAWTEGRPADFLAKETPAILGVDSEWKRGQALARFEVLDERAGQVEKRFAVRLHPKGPGAAREATFVVFGRDPVWVYREEDYTRMLNMDNNPTTPRPSRKR